MSDERVCFVLQDVHNGGVEKCLIHLARGFTERGVAVDLVVRRLPTDMRRHIVDGVNLVHLEGDNDSAETLAAKLAPGGRPNVLLAAKESDCKLALALRPRLESPVVMIASLDYTGQLDGRSASKLRRWARYRELRKLYGPADRIVCVSRGVAEDMARILGPVAPPLTSLPNPVVMPELDRLARAQPDHPWFADGDTSVILGVGRLSLIKNFPLLVRAFARVRRDRDARLMILGEGKQRQSLLNLAMRLGVADSVALPGHVTNPYAYMARARLFVLSSLWEGFGNVLVEALACGTPAVATDCRSGPAEILDHGRYGPLVPVGDESALADAMRRTLDAPLSADLLREAAGPYTLQASTDAYLSALVCSAR